MSHPLPGPWEPNEAQRFLDTFLYTPEAVLVSEIVRVDAETREIEARLDTTGPLPIAALQRADPEKHPAHVTGAEMIMMTGTLGCLHAWFFHGCRWDEGWAGFGNRIHRADFRELASLGPPMELRSRETKTRIGPKRIVLRYEFDFRQEGRKIYRGDQSAIFVHQGFA